MPYGQEREAAAHLVGQTNEQLICMQNVTSEETIIVTLWNVRIKLKFACITEEKTEWPLE